jgi:hypothetical protein
MPCNTITTTKLEMTKANADVLTMALEALGMTVTEKSGVKIVANSRGESLTWIAGKGITIKSTRTSKIASTLQQEYSKQAIQWVAKRSGWQVKQESENMFAVSKR